MSPSKDAPSINTELGERQQKGSPDAVPAHVLWVELVTRITTQPLHNLSGEEETAAESIFLLFPKIRELMEQHPDAKRFCDIALKLLNGSLRPYTTRWHKLMNESQEEDGRPRFRDEARRTFQSEMRELQPRLFGYVKAFKALSEGCLVQPEWLGPDEAATVTLLNEWQRTGKNTELGERQQKGSPDAVPAHVLWVELVTRIATQPLHDLSGEEETVAESVFLLFPKTRELMQQHPDAKRFCEIALKLMNGMRPYLARWHKGMKESQDGSPRFRDEARRTFQSEMRELQPRLLGYAKAFKALSEGCLVQPEWLGPDEPATAALPNEWPMEAQSEEKRRFEKADPMRPSGRPSLRWALILGVFLLILSIAALVYELISHTGTQGDGRPSPSPSATVAVP